MTWVKVAAGVEATHDGYFTYVMTLNRACGVKNRWDVTRVRGNVADTIASAVPPGQCRRVVLDAAMPRA